MVEIKRMNRLFSIESLHLTDFVLVPVFDESILEELPGVEVDDVRLSSPALSERSQGSSGEFGASGGPEPAEISTYQDIFSRIDSNTRAIAQNVQTLTKRGDRWVICSALGLV